MEEENEQVLVVEKGPGLEEEERGPVLAVGMT